MHLLHACLQLLQGWELLQGSPQGLPRVLLLLRLLLLHELHLKQGRAPRSLQHGGST
jgi:hypothetical protein